MSNASAAPDIGIAGAENLVYLVSCAVHGTTPDAARIDGMDLGAVYSLAERHMLSAAAAMALASAGREDRSFAQARGKAVAKAAQLEIEKDLLLEQMESAGIWYMPLKGAVLQKLYPAVGMRQMSDVDILFDAARAKDVREILERQGFSCKHFGAGAHDVYHKEPVCSFEMHRTLFEKKKSQRRMYEYYADVRKRLKKDQGNRCGYHFSSEDLYVFLTAHEFKHYNGIYPPGAACAGSCRLRSAQPPAGHGSVRGGRLFDGGEGHADRLPHRRDLRDLPAGRGPGDRDPGPRPIHLV